MRGPAGVPGLPASLPARPFVPMIPAPTAAAPAAPTAAQRHWRATRRLTAGLLAVWFSVTFVVCWFARDLDFAFFGWPFSFWVAAQGGGIVFIALIAFYARRMNAFDRDCRAHRGPGDA